MQKLTATLKSIPWKKILIGVVIILALAAAYIFWPVKVDLASLAVPEGKYDVRILRDSYGVPHIYGQTDPDVAYDSYTNQYLVVWEDESMTDTGIAGQRRGSLGGCGLFRQQISPSAGRARPAGLRAGRGTRPPLLPGRAS